jgi:hypothetical protein
VRRSGSGVRGLTTSNSWSTLVELVGVVVILVGVSTTDLVLELIKGDSRQSGSLVHDRSLVNSLVDGDGVVNGGRSDGLLLDHRLDSLVNVVVDVLIGNSAVVCFGALYLADLLRVLVHGSHTLELLSVFWEHLLLVLAGDLGDHLMTVLSLLDLLVLDRLHTVLVVMNVAFPVDGCMGMECFFF